MIKNNYTCGIDIGTSFTKVVVIGFNKEKKETEILTTGISETNGMRFGYVVNADAVAGSIKGPLNKLKIH